MDRFKSVRPSLWAVCVLLFAALSVHALADARKVSEPVSLVAERSAPSVSVYRGDILRLGVKTIGAQSTVHWYRSGELVGQGPTLELKTKSWFPGVHLVFAIVSDEYKTTQLQWNITVQTPQVNYVPKTVNPVMEPLKKKKHPNLTEYFTLKALHGTVVGYRGTEPLRVGQAEVPVYWSERLHVVNEDVARIYKKLNHEIFLMDGASTLLGMTAANQRVLRLGRGTLRIRNLKALESEVRIVVGQWLHLAFSPYADAVIQVFDEAESPRVVISQLQGAVKASYSLGSLDDAKSSGGLRTFDVARGEAFEIIKGSHVSPAIPIDVRDVSRVVKVTTPQFSASGCVKSTLMPQSYGKPRPSQDLPFVSCQYMAASPKRHPKNPKEWYQLGITRFGVMDLEGARRAFKKAYVEDEQFAEAAYAMGMLLMRVHQWEAGQEWFKKAAILGYPEEIELAYARGIAYLETGYPASAQHHLGVVANLDPDGPLGVSARELIDRASVSKNFHLQINLDAYSDTHPFPVLIDEDVVIKSALHTETMVNKLTVETGLKWNKDDGVQGEFLYSLDRRTYDEIPSGVESQSSHRLSARMALLFGDEPNQPSARFWLGPSSRVWLVDNEQALHTYELVGGLQLLKWMGAPQLSYERVIWKDYRSETFDPVVELTPWLGARSDQAAEELTTVLSGNIVSANFFRMVGQYGYSSMTPKGESPMKGEIFGLSLLLSHPIWGQWSYDVDSHLIRDENHQLGAWTQQQSAYTFMFNYSFSTSFFWKRDIWLSEEYDHIDRRQQGAQVQIRF